MELDDLSSSHPRHKVFYALLLVMLCVTWILFSQVIDYAWAQSDGVTMTGKVEGPAVTGWSPALDKTLAPVMRLLSCHEISFESPQKAARRISTCWFDTATHPVGEQVRLAYGEGEAAIADPMVAIRSGAAASLWLTFSLLIFFRLPHRRRIP